MLTKSSNLLPNPQNSPENSDSERMILKWITVLDVHFNRKEHLEAVEKKIYIEALRHFSADRLEAAFNACLGECKAMPKITDVKARLPYESPQRQTDEPEFVPVKDWVEPYSKTANLHFFESQEGYRRVRIEKIPA